MTVNPTKTSDDEQICALDKHAKSSGTSNVRVQPI
ncbi:unnamed protein product, partial [Tenebrio molitor]